MFIAPLFTTTQILKQPKCPSIDECIKKWCTYVYKNMTHPLKKKRRNEILLPTIT